MRTLIRPAALGVALGLTFTPALAQTAGDGLMADLKADVAEVEEKLTGLANAMPENTYAWRPGEGVRSVGDVFIHVAADNYFLGAVAMGETPPTATGIKTDDYGTVQAYEARSLDRAAIIRELSASFAYLKSAMDKAPADLGQTTQMFGRPSTHRRLWVLTTTHLHEHLGQAIAYARSNGVVPPWSR